MLFQYIGKKTTKLREIERAFSESFKRKITLLKMKSAFSILWKRKITLLEMESAFSISWKRKIILREIESAFSIPWKRNILLHYKSIVVFEILWKENLQPRNVIENVEKLIFLNSLEEKFLGKKIPWKDIPFNVIPRKKKFLVNR
jgi:hypothetical protein